MMAGVRGHEGSETGGLSAGGLEQLAATAAAHVADDKIPGLVAAVASGGDVHVEVRGSLSIGGPPVRRDSRFRIASTTKPITGAVTMALVDEGLLELDEAVDRLLPELADRRVLRRVDGPLDDTVPADRPITVRDLLTFTHGFGMSMDMFTAAEPWPVVAAAGALGLSTLGPPQPAVAPDPDTWIARLGTLPLMAQPGERWLYNTGAQVLGVLLSRAAGVPFDEVLRTRLFEPLGMASTGFWVDDPSCLATAYAPTPGGLEVWDPADGDWSRRPAFADAAAGLVSTVDDLLVFAQMLLRGGEPVLSRPSVDAMTSDQLSPAPRASSQGFLAGDRSWGFCQSVLVDGPRAGAFGWDGGLGSSWLVDPVRDLVVIVLTQRLFDSPRAPAVHRDLQAAAYALVAGQ